MIATADSVQFVFGNFVIQTKSISSITLNSTAKSFIICSGGERINIKYSEIVSYNGSQRIPQLPDLIVELRDFLRTASTTAISLSGVSEIKGDKGDSSITDDTGWVNALTNDYYNLTFFHLDRTYMSLVVKNTTENVCYLSGGITAGGFELFTNYPIAANGYTTIPINQTFLADTPLYFHHAGSGDDWNSASLNIKSTSNAI